MLEVCCGEMFNETRNIYGCSRTPWLHQGAAAVRHRCDSSLRIGEVDTVCTNAQTACVDIGRSAVVRSCDVRTIATHFRARIGPEGCDRHSSTGTHADNVDVSKIIPGLTAVFRGNHGVSAWLRNVHQE